MPLSTDLYRNDRSILPIMSVKAVTPSDSVDLPDGACRGLIVNGTGNLSFITANGETVTLTIGTSWFGVQNISARRILATGTTATGIFACY
jgi:hypothetical protein